MGLNDAAWEKLFDKYHILEEVEHSGQFFISAPQIKEFREPRLMTKFDHMANLPHLFAENNLAILPVSGNSYAISHFKAYHRFEEMQTQTVRVSLPSHIQSFAGNNIVSESIALNSAVAAGIMEDFLEDEELLATVSGKMGSGVFDFQIDHAAGGAPLCCSVSNSRIEIDAAYEGLRYLSLFEAKRDLADDFLVRQLYYPFRLWREKVTKPVKSIFLIFSNGVFYLYEYRFEDPLNYSSLQLIKQKNYIISTEISRSDIENLLRTVVQTEEPRISFPQANSMSRIVNLMELLFENPMTKQDITGEYAFDQRQTNYYTDAGRYLELIEKLRGENNNIIFRLSPLGRHIMELKYRDRQLAIAAQILKHKAFSRTLKICFQSGQMPDTKTVVQIMKDSDLYQVEAESTFRRRSSTITGWINWILNIIEK